MRAPDLNLAPQTPLRFKVTGVPVASSMPEYLLVSAITLVVLIIVFGFRGRVSPKGWFCRFRIWRPSATSYSRFWNACGSPDKGRMPGPRFERERSDYGTPRLALSRHR